MSRDRRWQALNDIIRGATVSATGLDIIIMCNDHRTKDQIIELLAGDSRAVERQWISDRIRRPTP